jgi:hypothetical protein
VRPCMACGQRGSGAAAGANDLQLLGGRVRSGVFLKESIAAGVQAPHLASAKSAPQMHTIVEVASSEEVGRGLITTAFGARRAVPPARTLCWTWFCSCSLPVIVSQTAAGCKHRGELG